MKLRFRYVRDRAATAHIWDHINDRQDHALCGRAYHDPIELAEGSRPPSVCRACQALAPQAEAALWKQLAEDSTKTLRKTEREYRKLAAEYEALSTEYESYVADYDTLYNDYEGLDNECESLWTEYERLWAAYEHLAVHADNQRRNLAQLQGARRPFSPKNPSSTRSSGASKSPKKAKKGSSGKINPSKKVPSGRRRVKFWS